MALVIITQENTNKKILLDFTYITTNQRNALRDRVGYTPIIDDGDGGLIDNPKTLFFTAVEYMVRLLNKDIKRDVKDKNISISRVQAEIIAETDAETYNLIS